MSFLTDLNKISRALYKASSVGTDIKNISKGNFKAPAQKAVRREAYKVAGKAIRNIKL